MTKIDLCRAPYVQHLSYRAPCVRQITCRALNLSEEHEGARRVACHARGLR